MGALLNSTNYILLLVHLIVAVHSASFFKNLVFKLPSLGHTTIPSKHIAALQRLRTDESLHKDLGPLSVTFSEDMLPTYTQFAKEAYDIIQNYERYLGTDVLTISDSHPFGFAVDVGTPCVKVCKSVNGVDCFCLFYYQNGFVNTYYPSARILKYETTFQDIITDFFNHAAIDEMFQDLKVKQYPVDEIREMIDAVRSYNSSELIELCYSILINKEHGNVKGASLRSHARNIHFFIARKSGTLFFHDWQKPNAQTEMYYKE